MDARRQWVIDSQCPKRQVSTDVESSISRLSFRTEAEEKHFRQSFEDIGGGKHKVKPSDWMPWRVRMLWEELARILARDTWQGCLPNLLTL